MKFFKDLKSLWDQLTTPEPPRHVQDDIAALEKDKLEKDNGGKPAFQNVWDDLNKKKAATGGQEKHAPQEAGDPEADTSAADTSAKEPS